MQHGEAKPEAEDPARPLSDRGRADVERVARAAAQLRLAIAIIHHSGKLRAEQTAQIVARHLSPVRSARKLPGLAPNDDPMLVRPLLDEASEPMMLVGHLPHLSRLTALLVTGDATREVVAFRMGGIVCLEKLEPDWRLKWILIPELAP